MNFRHEESCLLFYPIITYALPNFVNNSFEREICDNLLTKNTIKETRMIKKEILDLLKTKKTYLLFLVIVIIPFVDLLMNIWSCYGDYWLHPESYNSLPSWIYHPSKAAFLSGSSIGHISQMLLIWLLPFYLLFMYGDSYIKEQMIGYHNIVSIRKSKLAVFATKNVVGFIVGFIPTLVSVLLNYLLCLLCFKHGASFGGMEIFINEASNELLLISINSPVVTYFIYILVFSIISGMCGVMCVSFSFCFKSYKALYSACFVIWFGQIISPYSITYAIQPFIEYDFPYVIPAVCIFIFISMIALIAGYINKVRYEEL